MAMAVAGPSQAVPVHEIPSFSLSETAIQSEHTLLIASRNLYSLTRFRECSEILKVLCRNYPQNAAAKVELTRIIHRLIEQQRGKYNFKVLYQEASQPRPPCLDHANYVGPVEVRETDLRGRGLYTTKDVKAGDLLACEKAFAYAFVGRANMTTRAPLIERISERCSNTPSLIPSFTDMCHGTYEPKPCTEVDGRPVVDTHLIERVIDLNAFGGSISTRASHLSESYLSGHAHGIWILAAKINHACFYNCRRSFIGDMQIIRAAQDIQANTELYFTYRTPLAKDHDFEATQADLKSYGFVCGCALCEEASKTNPEVYQKRDVLRKELTAAFSTGGGKGSFDCSKVDTNRIEMVLTKMENTYRLSAQQIPRTGMWDPYLALSRMYAILGNSQKLIRNALKTLEVLGFVVKGGEYSGEKSKGPIIIEKWGLVVDYLIEFWMMLYTAYAAVGQKEKSESVRKLAVVSYCIVVGEDETFEESYGAKGKECLAKGVLWTGR